VAVPSQQSGADGIAPRHQAVAVVLDLVNPLRAGRGCSAGDGRHGSTKPEGVKRVRDNIPAKMGAQPKRRASLTGEPRLAR
jgi:hypothetical protein